MNPLHAAFLVVSGLVLCAVSVRLLVLALWRWDSDGQRYYVPPSPEPVRLFKLAGLEKDPPYAVRQRDLGADRTWAVEVEDGPWRELTAAADMLYRSGVALTPEFYAAQSVVERCALMDSHERMWAARAVAIGTASQGRVEAAHVLSRADGGAAAVRVELAEAALRGAREAAAAQGAKA